MYHWYHHNRHLCLPDVTRGVDQDQTSVEVGVELAKDIDGLDCITKVDEGNVYPVDVIILVPANGQGVTRNNSSSVSNLRKDVILIY